MDVHELRECAGVLDEVLEDIRIAVEHEDVADDLGDHPGAPAGDPLAPQPVDKGERLLIEVPEDDLPVREGGIVVGYFSVTGLCGHLISRVQGATKTGPENTASGYGGYASNERSAAPSAGGWFPFVRMGSPELAFWQAVSVLLNQFSPLISRSSP
jgi:hypothetical protein